MSDTRIARAIGLGVKYGGIDGAHHKTWVIDQMIRALTACPIVQKRAVDANGNPYTFDAFGESEQYQRVVREACNSEDGPNTYEWDTGVAP